MTRDQLAHVLRAASAIVAEDPHILVIGSQSVLAAFDEADLPDAATASVEVDLAFFDDLDVAKADRVDGAIGELSLFHEEFGVYAQGVSVDTAVLPAGWQERVVGWSSPDTGAARAVFLEPHDCVVSKLVAHRPKDLAFASSLLEAGLVDRAVLRSRVDLLPGSVDPRVLEAVRRFLDDRPRSLPRPRPVGDQGTVLVLVLGFTAVLLLMVGVVVNVSAAVLARRAVASAADGAAVAAAQALDTAELYRSGLPGERLPLSQADAQQRVAAYGRQLAASQPGLRLSVTVDGATASVVAVRQVRLPFSGVLGLRPLRVEATARARAPLVG